jgi:hypothetical protein
MAVAEKLSTQAVHVKGRRALLVVKGTMVRSKAVADRNFASIALRAQSFAIE